MSKLVQPLKNTIDVSVFVAYNRKIINKTPKSKFFIKSTKYFYLSIPSCSRKVTNPKAAGALWSIMAKKTIISTSAWLVVAAAPSATPSAAAWTTRPMVTVIFLSAGFTLSVLLWEIWNFKLDCSLTSFLSRRDTHHTKIISINKKIHSGRELLHDSLVDRVANIGEKYKAYSPESFSTCNIISTSKNKILLSTLHTNNNATHQKGYSLLEFFFL